uniref:Uncharacterized protein n=1 Tax=Salix viminalis TaxID=40686 RepID=A0A6N2LGK0_SALVM
MVQRLVDRPPNPVDRGVINQPVARQQPRIARNRAYDDSSDEDSEGEIAGAPENQQQRRNQPEYRIRADIPLFHGVGLLFGGKGCRWIDDAKEKPLFDLGEG